MFFDEQSGFKICTLFSREINEYTLHFSVGPFPKRVINPINFGMVSFVNNVEKIKNVCYVKKNVCCVNYASNCSFMN